MQPPVTTISAGRNVESGQGTGERGDREHAGEPDLCHQQAQQQRHERGPGRSSGTPSRLAPLERLRSYHPMSGISSQRYRMLVGSGVRRGAHRRAAPTETSRLEWTPLASVSRMITAGQAPDGPSLTALAFYPATTP